MRNLHKNLVIKLVGKRPLGRQRQRDNKILERGYNVTAFCLEAVT
jgi:hypothetical protein